MQEATTTPTVTDTKPHARGALDREMFCPRLQRLLLSAATELGQRGNLAQVVASIERGGAGGSAEDPNYGMLRRIGWREDVAKDGRYVPPSNIVGGLRELAQRWQQLERRQWATALALYVGTSRCHETLRATFGELAGVVLYRWQLKQAKARDRGASAGATTLAAELERVRSELAPIERELATVAAVLDTPIPQAEPRPERPADPEPPELVLRRSVIERQAREYWAPYRAACQAWASRPDVQALRTAQRARREAARRQEALLPLLAPLRAEQARLCAQQATLAAAGAACDDEQALVDLCRGKLDPDAREAMANAATTDVRSLHRAWYATALKIAKAWAEEGTTA